MICIPVHEASWLQDSCDAAPVVCCVRQSQEGLTDSGLSPQWMRRITWHAAVPPLCLHSMHQSSNTAARAAAPSTSAQLPADACSHTAAVQASRQLLNYLWVAVGTLREMQHVRGGLSTELDAQRGLHKRPQLRHGMRWRMLIRRKRSQGPGYTWTHSGDAVNIRKHMPTHMVLFTCEHTMD